MSTIHMVLESVRTVIFHRYIVLRWRLYSKSDRQHMRNLNQAIVERDDLRVALGVKQVQNVNRYIVNRYMGEETLLVVATYHNNIDAVYILLENGANPNRRAAYTDYPIQIAIRGQYLDIFELLVKYGADLSHTGTFGESGLELIRKSKIRTKFEDILKQQSGE